MILDDLFNFAAQNSKPGNVVQVSAIVLTNQTDGLQGSSNGFSFTRPPIDLVYVPGREIRAGFFSSPSFQPAPWSASSGLTITAPHPRFHVSDPYSIEWQWEGQSNAFAAAVDGTTNIIYGAAGKQFITISLCGLIAAPKP
jgi:hypothetical protein